MRLSPFKLLCVAGLLAIFSSTISKSPVLPLYASYLGAGPSGVGFVAAVSAFTGILASIPAGLLSDRIGRKRMLVAAALVFATAPFLYPLVASLWQLAVIRFYHGLATAIFIPVGMAMVTDLFQAERGERLSWFSTSTLLGRFLAPIAGGALIGALAFNPALGYRSVYLVCGGVGITALVLMIFIKEPEPPADAAPQRRRLLADFRSVISHRTIVVTAIVEAAILFAYGTFETFLPLYALQAGMGALAVGIFLSSQVITLALTKPVMGRFSDRHGRPRQIFAGAMLGAACIGGFSQLTGFVPLLGLSIVFGFSISIVTSATSAFIADLSGQDTLGSAMGVLGSIMDIGHTTGPLAGGILAASLGIGWAFFGASVVLAAASTTFLAAAGSAHARTAVS